MAPQYSNPQSPEDMNMGDDGDSFQGFDEESHYESRPGSGLHTEGNSPRSM
jgi:hypothetical protein